MTQTEKLIAFYGSLILAGMIGRSHFMGWVLLAFAVFYFILYLKDL